MTRRPVPVQPPLRPKPPPERPKDERLDDPAGRTLPVLAGGCPNFGE